MKTKEVLKAIKTELKSANKKYPNFHSCHEAEGVIREEFDEWWDEVKADKGLVPTKRMVEELVQLAAMVVKEIKRFEGEL